MLVNETKRLIIRPLSNTDHEFVIALLNDESFIKNIGDKGVRNKNDAINYLLEGPIASYKEHGFGLNVVCLKESNTAIGMCGLLKRADFDYADLGFAFLPKYSGKGFAQEASSFVLKDSFDHFSLPVISAVTLTDNIKSNQLLKRLGFVLKSEIEFHSTLNNYYELKKVEFK